MKVFKTSVILLLLVLPLLETTWATNLSQQEKVSYPCSVVLKPVKPIPNAIGTALITRVKQRYTDSPDSPWRERESVSIHADWLPSPSSFGDYDSYEGFAQVPNEISWRFKLSQFDPQSFWKGTTWVGNFPEITYGIPVNTLVQVRLSNSETQKLGPVVLENTLKDCH